MRGKSISELLSKYSRLPVPESFIIETFNRSLVEVLGDDYQLKSSEVSYRKGRLYIKCHPVVKTEIFLQKNRILEVCNQALGKKRVSDIQ
jgi:hypothetical protein